MVVFVNEGFALIENLSSYLECSITLLNCDVKINILHNREITTEKTTRIVLDAGPIAMTQNFGVTPTYRLTFLVNILNKHFIQKFQRLAQPVSLSDGHLVDIQKTTAFRIAHSTRTIKTIRILSCFWMPTSKNFFHALTVLNVFGALQNLLDYYFIHVTPTAWVQRNVRNLSSRIETIFDIDCRKKESQVLNYKSLPHFEKKISFIYMKLKSVIFAHLIDYLVLL